MNSFTHPLDRPGFPLHVGDRFVERVPGHPDRFTLVEIGAKRGTRDDLCAIELISLGDCDEDGGNFRPYGSRIAHMIPCGVIANEPGYFVRVEAVARRRAA